MSCVVVYVTGHGLGHATREMDILRRLPESMPLVVKTLSPEWFWRQEMGRSFAFVRDSFDVGCMQKNSIEVDIPATLVAARESEAVNSTRWESETAYLREVGARLVVTDVASFPLAVAARARIPAVCVANFTWADIYAEYVGMEPGFAPIVEKLRGEYAEADFCLEAGFTQPMTYFQRQESVGVVARPGHNRREELVGFLGEKVRGKRLALVYIGNWGMPIPWERLAEFDDWHFVTLGDLPAEVVNFSAARQEWMPHPDLVASVDLVISKTGYGLCAECLGAGTPLLFCPRPNFAEYDVLVKELAAWGGGIPVSTETFLGAEWGAVLATVPARGTLPKRPATGGEKAAAVLQKVWESGF